MKISAHYILAPLFYILVALAGRMFTNTQYFQTTVYPARQCNRDGLDNYLSIDRTLHGSPLQRT